MSCVRWFRFAHGLQQLRVRSDVEQTGTSSSSSSSSSWSPSDSCSGLSSSWVGSHEQSTAWPGFSASTASWMAPSDFVLGSSLTAPDRSRVETASFPPTAAASTSGGSPPYPPVGAPGPSPSPGCGSTRPTPPWRVSPRLPWPVDRICHSDLGARGRAPSEESAASLFPIFDQTSQASPEGIIDSSRDSSAQTRFHLKRREGQVAEDPFYSHIDSHNNRRGTAIHSCLTQAEPTQNDNSSSLLSSTPLFRNGNRISYAISGASTAAESSVDEPDNDQLVTSKQNWNNSAAAAASSKASTTDERSSALPQLLLQLLEAHKHRGGRGHPAKQKSSLAFLECDGPASGHVHEANDSLRYSHSTATPKKKSLSTLSATALGLGGFAVAPEDTVDGGGADTPAGTCCVSSVLSISLSLEEEERKQLGQLLKAQEPSPSLRLPALLHEAIYSTHKRFNGHRRTAQ
eukprot:GHVT01019603.1.p1 GENE.GHVT01019603.1~~GHVT01019603.1.p1  ORF type:complete len:459 (-),score=101.22 GHVT01019603.1:1187-2563(-)